MEYQIFGGVNALDSGRRCNIGGAAPRRILGLLLVHAGERVRTDTIVEVLWPERGDEARQVNNVRTYLSRLRAALGEEQGGIVTVDGGYRIDLAGHCLDADEFSQLVASAGAAPPQQAISLLDKALSLCARGRPYGDFADEDWARAEAARLDELRMRALEQRADARLASGAHADLVAELQPLVLEHPLRESFQRLLMLALYRSGRQAEALRVYGSYREYLALETGLDPSDAMTALEGRIATSDPALSAAATGVTVRGYQLGEKIGEGAFGSVYRATQPAVGREVAIKLIRPEYADDPDFIRRFEFEAQLVARLEHPHVVPLYDYWREPGAAYLVLRWIRGGSLAQILESAPLTLDETVRLVSQIGAALASAHDAGIIHRDVKPGNILIDERGDAYLTDFGIAVDDTHNIDAGLASAGSPMYVSPEQVQSRELTPRSDIYSLSVVIYEALTGRAPFESTSIRQLYEEKMARAVGRIGDVRRGIPDAVDGLLVRATAPDPGLRPGSVRELVAQFTNAATPTESEHPADRRRPGTATVVSLDSVGHNPYKGLRAFREADAAFFFGREELGAELVERVQHTRFLTLVGPSGSGKSSVVRAAVVPAVRAGAIPGSDRWFVVTMIPGAHPFEELETGLLRVAVDPPTSLLGLLREAPRGIARAVKRLLPPDEDAELLLLIDQFEELFTLTEPANRDAFLTSLVEAVTEQGSRIRVIATLRADFYDRPLANPALGEITRANTVAIAPLSPEGLERAIARPAGRLGVELESALTAQIVSDFAKSPGSLPLLQYALTELFERRSGSILGIDSYHALGGLSGSLAGRADEIFAALDPDDQQATRRLFGRLITPGDGADDTRRRARRSELSTVPEPVIEAFGKARLLSFDRDPSSREPTVEVAHEALISRWPRLRGWVNEDREGLRILRHLADGARAWDTGGRDPGELYRGARLQAAEEWADGNAGLLSAVEQDFLDASLASRSADLEAERQRIAHQARQNRRLRRLVAGIAVALVGALVTGVFALQQRQRATAEAAHANSARSAGETRRLAADAPSLVDTNRRVALLLAAEAYRRNQTPETLGALEHVLTHTGGLLGYLGEDRAYTRTTWTDDSQRLVAGRVDGIDVFDVGSGERLVEIPVVTGEALAVSPDGKLIASATGGGGVVVFDGQTGAEHTRLAQTSSVRALAFGPTGSVLAVGDRGGMLRLFDAASGDQLFAIDAHPEQDFPQDSPAVLSHEPASYPVGVLHVAFSGDGSLVGTVGGVFIRTWSSETGAAIHQTTVSEPSGTNERGRGRPMVVGLDSTGANATTVSGRFLQVWDLAEGTAAVEHELSVSLVAGLQGETSGASLREFSALVSEGDNVSVVDRVTGRPRFDPVALQAGGGGTPTLSPDERTIAAPGTSGVVLWATDGRSLLGRAVAYAMPDGTQAYVNNDGTLLVTQALGNRRPAQLFDLGVEPAEARDTGDRYLRFLLDRMGPVGAQDFEAGAFALDPGSLAVRATYPRANVYGSATSPDGSMITMGSGPPDEVGLRVIDAETGVDLAPSIEGLPTVVDRDDSVTSVAFSPDGARLAVATRSGASLVLDTATWEQVGAQLSAGNGGVVAVAYSPDRAYLATLNRAGEILIRDAATYQPVGPPLVGGTGSSEAALSLVLAFTPDSRYLISTADGSARIWDVEQRVIVGSPIESPPGRAVTVSVNGRWLVQPTREQIAIVEIAPERWFDVACQAAGRNLTANEWDQFGPTDITPQATCPSWPAAAPTESATS